MPKKPTKRLTFSQHKDRWKDCQLCDLCKTRDKIVLLRGTVPAPILFIGEAPGLAENVLGSPFKGPAGKLLDGILLLSGLKKGDYAMTNLIACAPILPEGGIVEQPPAYAIKACKDRLTETVRLVSPELVMTVGTYAERWFNEKHLGELTAIPHVSLVHPATILRMSPAQQGLVYQRTIIQIKDAIEECLS